MQGLQSKHLVRVIAVLLASIGIMMLVEVTRPFSYAAVVPAPAIHVAVGFVIGIGIGLVSSVLGVARGELLIPTLMFVFGAGIKTAGSASILMSPRVVLSELGRYWRLWPRAPSRPRPRTWPIVNTRQGKFTLFSACPYG